MFCISYMLNVEEFRTVSIHLRFKETHEYLLRVDINSPRHENSDGTVLKQGEHHIHIYSNLNKRWDTIAYPISLEEFPDVLTLIETFEAFLRKAKIKERTN